MRAVRLSETCAPVRRACCSVRGHIWLSKLLGGNFLEGNPKESPYHSLFGVVIVSFFKFRSVYSVMSFLKHLCLIFFSDGACCCVSEGQSVGTLDGVEKMNVEQNRCDWVGFFPMGTKLESLLYAAIGSCVEQTVDTSTSGRCVARQQSSTGKDGRDEGQGEVVAVCMMARTHTQLAVAEIRAARHCVTRGKAQPPRQSLAFVADGHRFGRAVSTLKTAFTTTAREITYCTASNEICKMLK